MLIYHFQVFLRPQAHCFVPQINAEQSRVTSPQAVVGATIRGNYFTIQEHQRQAQEARLWEEMAQLATFAQRTWGLIATLIPNRRQPSFVKTRATIVGKITTVHTRARMPRRPRAKNRDRTLKQED